MGVNRTFVLGRKIVKRGRILVAYRAIIDAGVQGAWFGRVVVMPAPDKINNGTLLVIGAGINDSRLSQGGFAIMEEVNGFVLDVKKHNSAHFVNHYNGHLLNECVIISVVSNRRLYKMTLSRMPSKL